MGSLRKFAANRLSAPLSLVGLLLGALAFLAALTPSLIPRPGPVQGALAGVAFAIGYGVGTGAAILWAWLGLPALPRPMRTRGAQNKRRALESGCALRAAHGTRLARLHSCGPGLARRRDRAADDHRRCQLRRCRGCALPGPALPAAQGSLLLPIERVLPTRASVLVASVLATWSFWAIGNGLLLDAVLRGLDTTYREIDASTGRKSLRPTIR